MGEITKYTQLFNTFFGQLLTAQSNKSIPIANWNLENAFRHRKDFMGEWAVFNECAKLGKCKKLFWAQAHKL